MYSRKILVLDTQNVPEALRILLQQINLIQEESEQEIQQLKKKIKTLEGEK